MAYGTPRAAKWRGYYYDVACLTYYVEQGYIRPIAGETLDRLKISYFYYLEEYQLPDPELSFEFVERMLAKGLFDVENILLEGQSPDQDMLDTYACSRCKKPLREKCTDY